MSGIRGETGSLTGLNLLESLETLRCSGTLVLEQFPNSLIGLLVEGRLEASYTLGQFDALDTKALQFHFEPHAPSDVALVESFFSASSVAALRAVPALGLFTVLQAPFELGRVLDALGEHAFTGCLCLREPLSSSVLLYYAGGLKAALFEQDGYVRDGLDALRALNRSSAKGEVSLHKRALNPSFVEALVGLAHGHRKPYHADLTGLGVSEKGYTFFVGGHPVLRVRAELRGAVGHYSYPEALPDLVLPNEPAGWEDRHYALTLRGKDALNPMTDMSIRFKDLFDRSGRRILEGLAQGLNVEATAQVTKLELDSLRPYLDKLEQEGLIQAVPD